MNGIGESNKACLTRMPGLACVVGATTPSGSTDISAYYRRWRIADYVVVLAIDSEGRAICPTEGAA
ncbi:hypothetical protein EPO44_12290 [bacterium]|nr:MAG: hypothetical protein EPO44_12290 [bacterium]